MRQLLARLALEFMLRGRLPFLQWRVKRFAQRFLNGVPVHSPYGPRMVTRFGDGTWEITIGGRREIKSHLSDLTAGDIFVDVGANDGSYSLVASEKVGPGGIVLAFEPNPWVFVDLIKNVDLNECRNVIAMNIAIGDSAGPILFSHKAGQTGTGRLGGDAGEISWTAIVEKIQSDSGIAEACKNRTLIVKIDVEGAEYSALIGLQGLLDGATCKKLIVEIDERHLARYGTSVSDLVALAKTFGLQPTINAETGHYDEVFVRADR